MKKKREDLKQMFSCDRGMKHPLSEKNVEKKVWSIDFFLVVKQ